tara:strand:- start:685 stop:891 length:207 start_codon:yes stop_codon:yes gene_type:complete
MAGVAQTLRILGIQITPSLLCLKSVEGALGLDQDGLSGGIVPRQAVATWVHGVRAMPRQALAGLADDE